MICVPVTGKSVPEVREQMAAAAKVADLVELRMDYMPGLALRALLENRPCPVIVTNRPLREGGAFAGAEADRVALLNEAVTLHAEYVDIEADSIVRIKRGPGTKFIVSHHDFERLPDNLEEIHSRIADSGADIVKIACMVRDIRENLRIFSLLRNSARPTILIGMGELGLVSRILGRKFGNVLTFGSLAHGKESAPGQITAQELRELYRYKKIGPGTDIYGVIANPVSHSMSPAIHNAAFEAAGIDAVYVPFKVEGDPVDFVRAYHTIGVRGYSVTLPHKERIIAAMDETDNLVKRIGALNTVVNRHGKLCGTNTDVSGAIGALEELGPLRGKKALLIGAGGAARAVAYGLIDRGAQVIIANRTLERGAKLAAEIGCEFCPLAEADSIRADVLINTTSVGMKPHTDEMPVRANALRAGMIVFDAVYNPPETRLLREAAALGCRTISGVEWFVRQAAAQFELWTGTPAPRAVMERVVYGKLV